MAFDNIITIIASWAAVGMFVLSLSVHLDKITDSNIKKKISTFLQDFPSMNFSELIEQSNIIFIRLFDIIYIDKTPKTFRYGIWLLIVVSFFFAYTIAPISQLQKNPALPLENILLLSLFLAGVLILGWIFYHYLKNHLLMASVLCAILFTYIFKKILAFSAPFSFLLVILLVCYINIFYKITDKIHNKFGFSIYQISPLRAMFSSFLIIIVISLIKLDVGKSFISDLSQTGIILLSFLLLNLFADSISLWETRIILNLTTTGSKFRFVILLLADVLFSILIFLSIPISTGNLDIFLSALWFQGDLPWLGILFWSTFFTSAVFWFYLLSIILLKILQKMMQYFLKLDGILLIKDKPILCLALLFMVPVTLFFFLMALA